MGVDSNRSGKHEFAPGRKRGRDKYGKKVRWTDERKLRENVLMLSEKAKKGLDSLQDMRNEHAAAVGPELTAKERVRQEQMQKRKKNRIEQKKKEYAKKQHVEAETGDIITAHDFSDSFDAEEEEIKDEKTNKRIADLEKKARGLRKVFVKGLSFSTKMEEVQEHFSSCGKIVDVQYPHHPEGKPKGFAFVEFDSDEAVVKALMMDGKVFQHRSLVISVVKEKGKGKGKGKKRRSGDDDDGSDDDSEASPDFEYDCDSSGSDSGGGGKRKSAPKAKATKKKGGKVKKKGGKRR